MSGLHVVPKPRKSGTRWYVYAWRGGPQIHHQDDSRPVITPDLLDKAMAARREANGFSPDTLAAVIVDYKASPEFTRLEPSTQRDYRLWLDRMDDKFGDARLGAFEDRRMRGSVIEWRDEWRRQPRSADKAVTMLSTVLAWAVDHGRIAINVAAGIKTLHRVNKADEIWEDRHFRAMVNCSPQLRNALKLALLTGLRLGDLVHLQWENVGPQSIILTTRKRKGRAVIPILPPLRHLLKRLKGKREKGPVLLNSRGQQWTESGLGTVFQRGKPKGFDRRIHDLRGTFVTWLAIKGLTNDEIARVVGWTSKRVEAIRARYVDEARVVVSLVERLSA